jgi:hypothetical protein
LEGNRATVGDAPDFAYPQSCKQRPLVRVVGQPAELQEKPGNLILRGASLRIASRSGGVGLHGRAVLFDTGLVKVGTHHRFGMVCYFVWKTLPNLKIGGQDGTAVFRVMTICNALWKRCMDSRKGKEAFAKFEESALRALPGAANELHQRHWLCAIRRLAKGSPLDAVFPVWMSLVRLAVGAWGAVLRRGARNLAARPGRQRSSASMITIVRCKFDTDPTRTAWYAGIFSSQVGLAYRWHWTMRDSGWVGLTRWDFFGCTSISLMLLPPAGSSPSCQ